MCRPREVDVKYRENLEAYNQWEEQERERQDKVIAVARMQLRERHRYFNPLRWLLDRWSWLKWFSL